MSGGSRAGAGGLLARRDLRRRWRTVVAFGLLFGVAAGIGLGCLAGARRTSSLFARHLEATNAADVEIDPGNPSPAIDRQMRSLPHVVDSAWWATISAYPLDEDGKVDLEFQQGLTFTTDGRYLDMDRVVVAEGRRLDPDRPDEVMLNPLYAAILDASVGDTVPIGYVPADEDGVPTTRRPTATIDARVVGIMALNDDVIAEVIDQVPRMFVSPAFAPPDDGQSYVGFAWYGLRLEHGPADADEAIRAWQAIVREHNAGIGPNEIGLLGFVHRIEDQQRKADRSVRPLVVALGAFGALATLAALVLAAQAVSRMIRERSEDTRLARMVGLARRPATAVGLAVPAVAIGLAAVTSVVTALAVSRAFPLGPYDVVEPNPGVSVDLTVLAPGLALVLLVPLATAVLVARREARAPLLERATAVRRPSALVDRLARSGSPTPVVAATRFTVETGRGRTYVPVRSVVVSSVVIVGVIVTTLVFGANLDALNADPVRFGWRADAAAAADGGYGGLSPDAIAAFDEAQDDIVGWQAVGADRTTVAGRETPGVAFGPGREADFGPVLLDGRAPTQGEIVLGRQTLDAIDARIGDQVEIGTGEAARTVTIVGTAVFPDVGPVLAIRTGLDEGVWLDRHDNDVFDLIGQYGPPWNSPCSVSVPTPTSPPSPTPPTQPSATGPAASTSSG